MSDFTSVLPAGDEALSHKQADNYIVALVYNAEDETDGTALLRQDGQAWSLLSRVGGTFSAEDLHRLGVPSQLWNQLLVTPVGETEFEEALQSGPGWPVTEEIELAPEDLIGVTAWEKLLMASEILARKGCLFEETPLREYFDARAWYEPDEDFSEEFLTPIERNNLAFLR